MSPRTDRIPTSRTPLFRVHGSLTRAREPEVFKKASADAAVELRERRPVSRRAPTGRRTRRSCPTRSTGRPPTPGSGVRRGPAGVVVVSAGQPTVLVQGEQDVRLARDRVHGLRRAGAGSIKFLRFAAGSTRSSLSPSAGRSRTERFEAPSRAFIIPRSGLLLDPLEGPHEYPRVGRLCRSSSDGLAVLGMANAS